MVRCFLASKWLGYTVCFCNRDRRGGYRRGHAPGWRACAQPLRGHSPHDSRDAELMIWFKNDLRT
jgi:hypothetical protein